MLDAVGRLTDNIDKGLMTSLTTADTSKAFDSVEHGRLLEKLAKAAGLLAARRQATPG